jgi:hypothetical protein
MELQEELFGVGSRFLILLNCFPTFSFTKIFDHTNLGLDPRSIHQIRQKAGSVSKSVNPDLAS